MINLRYHIVSITAVFLALGIGITMGSTFLGRTALDQIDANVDRARNERNEVRAENARLRTAVSTFEERGEALTEEGAQQIFEGRLTDVPVVLIAASGIDQDSVDNLRVALRGSGAEFGGTLVVTDNLALDGTDAAKLAQLLGVTFENPDRLRGRVTDKVANELLAKAEPQDSPGTPTTRVTIITTTTTPIGTDGTTTVSTTTEGSTTTEPDPVATTETLDALVDEGFLDFQPPTENVELLTGDGYRYVVVTGPDPDLPDAAFLQPLLQEMTQDQPAPVVVASAATGDDPEAVREVALEPLKQDEDIGERISTVNNLEDFAGIAAVILAVDDLGSGRYGHYGVGDEVKSLLPSDEGG